LTLVIRMNWKKGTALAALIAGLLAFGAQAQVLDFTITSAPSPVGSGARAMGQAGAFIATADDGTAASWNPAALIILEKPEAAVVGSSEGQARLYRDEDDQSFTSYSFNYIAASYPFSIKEKNFVVSLNYQRLFDFNYHLERNLAGLVPSQVAYGAASFDDHPCGCLDAGGGFIPCDGSAGPVASYIPCTAGTPTDPTDDFYLGVVNQDVKRVQALRQEVTQTGDIGAVAPAFAVQIIPRFSLGFTYNFWMDGFVNRGYTRTTEQRQTVFEQNNSFTFQDLNLNLEYDPGIDVGFPAPGVPTVTRSHLKIDERFRFRGQNFNLGLLAKVTGRTSVGLVWRSGFDADVKWKYEYLQTQSRLVGDTFQQIGSATRSHFSEDITMHFPDSFGLGVANRFSDAFSMEADATLVRWDTFTTEMIVTDPLTGRRRKETFSAVSGLRRSESGVDPTATVRLGGEYIFIREKYAVPLRAGAFYDPQPAEKSPQNYWGGTLGAGFAWKGIIVDAAYIYRFANDVDLITTTNAAGTRLAQIERGDVQQHSFLLSTIYHFE